MKNLLNEPWGKLDYDEKQSRLFIELANPDKEQFEKIIDFAVKTVDTVHPQDFLADLSKRLGSTQEMQDYAVEQFKKVMNKGLKRMAVVKPRNPVDEKSVNKFVERMENTNVRAFDTSRDAVHWLDSQSGLEKAA